MTVQQTQTEDIDGVIVEIHLGTWFNEYDPMPSWL